MANDILDFVAPVEDKMQGIIKVVGVGGGGCNAVRNITRFSWVLALALVAILNRESASARRASRISGSC